MNKKEYSDLQDFVKLASKKLDRGVSIAEQEAKIIDRLKAYKLIGDIEEHIDLNSSEVMGIIKNYCFHEGEIAAIFKGDEKTNWLKEDKVNISWNYYKRYEEYLFDKGWKPITITNNDKYTDQILNEMGNPNTNEFFNVKGLVIGDIQSGKTASYTALINKSVDAGYKLVIVLAGLTNDLRSQTQQRLDKEVLGYQTNPDLKKTKEFGVSKYGNKKMPFEINSLTSSVSVGDFNSIFSKYQTLSLDASTQPYLLVCKKNVAVLNNLLDFLTKARGNKTNGKLDIPVLIIDDEVDQASVNTKKESHIDSASAINKGIRKILGSLNSYSYVGYTATPFANAFIDLMPNDDEESKDLFPKDFIICLPTPSEYSGVNEFFGTNHINDNEDDLDAINLDLVVELKDVDEMFDEKNVKASSQVVKIPQSLKNAIIHFIIASAIKRLRGIDGHNSMLIHIARFKNPSTTLEPLISSYIAELYLRYKNEKDFSKVFKDYWEKYVCPVTYKRNGEMLEKWEDINEYLLIVLEQSAKNIKVVNGDVGDVCDYSDDALFQHIIIGGDKLSRGLTLEGLVVSYYNRNSNQADSLLQMGRWFGYRSGWIDLCRIFANKKIVNDFINAGLALEEFKKDINNMNSELMTPVEFAMKVRYNPKLAPTAKSKMKSVVKQKVSFSGTVQQIISYDRDKINDNRSTVSNFVGCLGDGEKSGNKVIYRNINPSLIKDLISNYKECETLPGSISIVNWKNYIEKLNSVGELENWTVVINSITNTNETKNDNLLGFDVIKGSRTDRRLDFESIDTYSNIKLKTLIDPTDFKEFFQRNTEEYKIIDHYTTKNNTLESSIIKEKFDSKKALLSIYIFDVYNKKALTDENNKSILTPKMQQKYGKDKILESGVVGIAIWFPNTVKYENSAIEYYINKSAE